MDLGVGTPGILKGLSLSLCPQPRLGLSRPSVLDICMVRGWVRWSFNTLTVGHSRSLSKNYVKGFVLSYSVMGNSLQPHLLQPARLLCPWSSLGKNTGVGYHSLLQGIFLTQGSNLDLLHHRWSLYLLNHKGNTLIEHMKCQSETVSSMWKLPIFL